MPLVKHSALVAHAATDMYSMVLDVASYPEFLPWCKGARVIELTADRQLAAISISSTFSQSEFSTENDLQAGESISMRLVDGPFKKLHGSWSFSALSDSACKVELELDYEFAAGSVGRAIKPVFTKVASTLIDAFVKEADRRFSHGS